MGRKKKVAPEAEATVEKKTHGKVFEYGDLAVVCSCGRTQILQSGMEGGFQIIMTTNEASYIQLKCDSCDADIKLCFLEGVKPEPVITDETPKTNESIQEENKQEESL